jgi:hypothetical protein
MGSEKKDGWEREQWPETEMERTGAGRVVAWSS